MLERREGMRGMTEDSRIGGTRGTDGRSVETIEETTGGNAEKIASMTMRVAGSKELLVATKGTIEDAMTATPDMVDIADTDPPDDGAAVGRMAAPHCHAPMPVTVGGTCLNILRSH